MLVASALAAVCLFGLARAWGRLRGTTLAAPWAWLVAAVVYAGALCAALAAADAARQPAGGWAALLLYGAALLSLCPTVALLGAKRPQDRAWQAIVASFVAAMLVAPAGSLALGGAKALSLHPAQSGFLIVLAAMGTVNWLVTAYGPAAIALTLGQGALIGAVLWPARIDAARGLLAFLAATLAMLVCCQKATRRRGGDLLRWRWLDFRDQFGLFWAARVMARFNVAAEAHRWPVRLTWRGVHRMESEESTAAAERALSMLLRRFVSAEWIHQRQRGTDR